MGNRSESDVLWPTALTLAMAAMLEILLSENPELKGKVIAKLERMSEQATEGQDDFANVLTWLRQMGN